MPNVTIIVETGTGATNSNSYATVANCNGYHQGHIYATDWDGASVNTQQDVLVMATRIIDASYIFNGWKTKTDQALQWPRSKAPDPDRQGYFDNNVIPQDLINAVCETARELIKQDPTDEPEGQGLKRLKMAGSVDMHFDRSDRKPMIPYLAQRMLQGLGTLKGNSSTVAKLIRT